MRKWEVPNERKADNIGPTTASLRQMLTNHWQADEGSLAEGDTADQHRTMLVTGTNLSEIQAQAVNSVGCDTDGRMPGFRNGELGSVRHR